MKTRAYHFMAILIILALGEVPKAGAQDHPHDAPHGGQVVTVGSYHFEMLVEAKQIKLYVLDGKMQSIPLQGMEGTLLVQLPDKTKKTLALKAGGEFLNAPLDQDLESFVAIATVKINGKPHVGRFRYPSKEHSGSAHDDHKTHKH